MKRAITAAVLALATIVAAPGSAFAHDPIVVGSTECRPSETSPWTVVWTVYSDSDNPDLTWSIRTPGGYSTTQPTEQRPYNETFTRSQEYPASQASATETVLADYWIGGVYDKPSTRSGTVARPPVCEGSGTTTTTTPQGGVTPTSTTTTTVVDGGTTTTTPDGGSGTTTTTPDGGSGTTTTTPDSGSGTTTTIVDSGAGGTTTTAPTGGSGTGTTVASAAGGGRTPGAELPATGRDGHADTAAIALVLLLSGVVLVMVTRRTTSA